MAIGWILRGVCGMLVGAASAAAQAVPPMAVDAHPSFEVVTVKPTPVEQQNQGIQTRGTHVKVVRETVMGLVMFSYGVHKLQITNAPPWMTDEFYDVDGIPDVPGEPNLKQLQELVQKLLADRFGLKLHPDRRELGYFALRVAEGMPKLERSKSPAGALPDQSGRSTNEGWVMKYTNNTMDDFTLGLQFFLDRPVVNETGLDGRFDFALRWAPDNIKVSEQPENASPGLFTALKEQLGLKAEPAKGPVKVLVVDAVNRPAAN